VVHHGLELGTGASSGEEQLCLFLGEDATGLSEPGNDLGPSRAAAVTGDRGRLKLAQLGARDRDPHSVLLAKIHEDSDVIFDAEHGPETVLIVRHQILDGKGLHRRQRSRLVEGTSGQQAPWRRAGIHHYQYAPFLAQA
jgi:hypothetical protein